MSIKGIQNNTAQVNDLMKQLETFQNKGTNTSVKSETSPVTQLSDPNAATRLAGQFVRSRNSLGSSVRQKELASLLKSNAQSSPEQLNNSINQIATAAKQTDPARQARTEKSLSTAKEIVDNGSNDQRNMVSRPLNQTSDAVASNPTLDTLNKILDTFNQIVDLMKNVIDMVKSSMTPAPAPTPTTPTTPTPVPTPTTPTTPAPTTGGNDVAAARDRLTQIGFAGSTMRQITDSSAVRMAKLNDGLLTQLAVGSAENERAFARKMDGLPQDTFDKLATLGADEQSRIAKLSSQQIIDEIKKKTTEPTPTPTPTPGGDVAAARDRLTKIGFAGSTMRQITDSSAVKMSKLNDGLLTDIARGSADNERAFARKIDGLPQDAFDKLAGLPAADQTRIAKLSSQQIVSELGKITPPPPPNPELNAAREKLTRLGFTSDSLGKISNGATLKLAKLNDGILGEIGAGNTAAETSFATKIDSLPQEVFTKLTGLSASEQSRVGKLSGQQIIDELTKITPPPGPDKNLGAAFSNAVDVILGRKPATDAEKAAATEVLKKNFVTDSFVNAREKRKDPVLLGDVYPKGKELTVGSGNKKVFWTGYDNIHFQARHTAEHFDTADIKAKNGFWPAGTSIQDINKYIESIVTTYKSQIELPAAGSTGPGFKYYEFDLPENKDIRVQIGIQSDGRVTSFFALGGPGVTNFSDADARKLLSAVGKA